MTDFAYKIWGGLFFFHPNRTIWPWMPSSGGYEFNLLAPLHVDKRHVNALVTPVKGIMPGILYR